MRSPFSLFSFVKAKVSLGVQVISAKNKALPLFIILSLVSPIMLFGFEWKATAKTKQQEAAPVNEAPENYLFSEDSPLLKRAFDFPIVQKIKEIGNELSIKELPDGFEIAKQPTLIERIGKAFNLESLNATNTINAIPPVPTGSVEFDFDGDGNADVARWKSGTAEFKIKNSNGGTFSTYTLGTSGSKPAPGDYDGDGNTDAAVFNAGTWTYRKSTTGTTHTVSFGTSGDVPMVGDYDGDGKSDFAYFRPSNNTWYILKSSDSATVTHAFGSTGDIAVAGNYDGDSYTDIAVYRPSTGYWHINGTTSGYFSFPWGVSYDVPMAADFDGDGKTDATVYRPTDGNWYSLKSSTGFSGSFIQQSWGNYGDQPVPADFDGDGKADFAVWRPTTGVWHILNSDDSSYSYETLGIPGDTAALSAYTKQTGSQVFGYELAKSRLSPKNSTGGTDLYSRNFAWGTSLVGLSGRSGLNAGFGMGYNSLVWVKDTSNSSIVFDPDTSNITPGFRFGFPVIEPVYYDDDKDRFAYMMVSASGGRTEFRQAEVRGEYLTADSGYTLLKTTGASNPNDPVENISITVSGTDGSKMTFEWKAGAFRASQIKDRNGNYITINHDAQGVLRTFTDTLGRVVTVNYDAGLYPTSITQTWKDSNGSGSNVTHTWASFSYTTKTIDTDFSGLTVVGPTDTSVLKVLQKVTYSDGSYTQFDHNSYGQVWKIRNFAANDGLLNQIRNDLETPAASQTDCPRFSETYSKVTNFNGDNEVKITNTLSYGHSVVDFDGSTVTAALIQTAMVGHPTGNITNTYVGQSGWMESLPIRTDDYADEGYGAGIKRSNWTKWTQDNTGLSYQENPRVIATKVSDGTNTNKTEIDYMLSPSTNIAIFGLVDEVRVYDSDLTTVLKKSETDYNLTSPYRTKRIIGLPSEVRSYGLESTGLNLMSKVTLAYDEGDFSDTGLSQNISPVQHDSTNFGSAFIAGRGNLTSSTKHDVLGVSSPITSSVKYNTTGAVVSQTDPMSRTVKIGYGDNFNSSPGVSTFAYVTSMTDPANNSSTVKYRYDTGANIEATSPAPAGNTYGKTTKRIYDSIGRLQRNSVYVNTTEHAYTRYEYPTNGVHSKVFATLVDVDNDGADADDEVLSESWTDGAGRTRLTRTPHTFSGGSTASWAGTIAEYDILGQVKRQSVPTEVDSSWNATGDDATRGFLWTHQKYDWMGRVVRKINTDGVDSPTLNDSDVLISYEGCGCAGGLVTTIQSELVPIPDTTNFARRKQKSYADILGRNWKTESFEWDGSTVYSTATNTFNGRDQVTLSRQYAGSTSSTTFQDTTAAFDGFGRMVSSHNPEQRDENDLPTYTNYTFNYDDSPASKTDARGATTHFYYNNRGLLEQKSWSVPSGSDIEVPATVEFEYDNLGNRISMEDALGRMDYSYDSLSRLTNEVRQFNDTLSQAPESGNRYRLAYTYSISGHLKSLTDPFGDAIYYTRDKTGRLKGVSGSSYDNVTNYASSAEYRAWDGLKQITYGNGVTINNEFNNRLQASSSQLSESSTDIFDKEYNYYADGQLSYIKDNQNPMFDRLNKYDSQKRVQFALTGAHAREQTETNHQNIPYKYSYIYDNFNNITSATLSHYTQASGVAAQFTNQRRQYIEYDNDGRPLESAEDYITFEYLFPGYGGGGYSIQDTIKNVDQYDADGKLFNSKENRERLKTDIVNNTNTVENFDAGEKIQTIDGNSLVAKSDGWYMIDAIDPLERANQPAEPLYFIRSSLLNGDVVTTVKGSNHNGSKFQTTVYADGAILAVQTSILPRKYVEWQYKDPSGATNASRFSASSVSGGNFSERDPHGVRLGQNYHAVEPPSAPLPEPRPAGGFGFDWENYYPDMFMGGGYMGNRRTDCVVDGHPTLNCNSEYHNMRHGGVTLDALKNHQFIFVNFGLVEVKRREAIYQNTGGDVSIVDEESGKILESAGHEQTGKEIIGYQEVTSWEMPLLTDIETVGFNEKELQMISAAMMAMGTEECAKAFQRAGLNHLGQLGMPLVIFPLRYVESPLYKKDLGLNPDSQKDEAFRQSMNRAFNDSHTTNDVTTQLPHNGKLYMGLAQRAFDEDDVAFGITFVHSVMHAGGAIGKNTHNVTTTRTELTRTPGQRFPHAPSKKITTTKVVRNSPGQDDLTWMKKEHDQIINSCTK